MEIKVRIEMNNNICSWNMKIVFSPQTVYEFSYKLRAKHSYVALSYIDNAGCQDILVSANDTLGGTR
jgi:hypothetical protein